MNAMIESFRERAEAVGASVELRGLRPSQHISSRRAKLTGRRYHKGSWIERAGWSSLSWLKRRLPTTISSFLKRLRDHLVDLCCFE
jgi:hypothetical protein